MAWHSGLCVRLMKVRLPVRQEFEPCPGLNSYLKK